MLPAPSLYTKVRDSYCSLDLCPTSCLKHPVAEREGKCFRRGEGAGKRSEGKSSKLTGKMQTGPIGASELHLTPRWLPSPCAAAGVSRLPAFANNSLGAQGCAGRPPPRPTDWPRSPAHHALLSQWAKAERSCGRWEGSAGRRGRHSRPGNLAASTGLPLLGGREEQLILAAPSRLAA